MGGASRPARLDDSEPEPGEQRPPLADVQPEHAHLGVRQQGPERARPDGALGRGGAHTIGFSQCQNFRDHIYTDTNVDASFAALRRASCPAASGSGDSNLAPLDVQTQLAFDNAYYGNLVARRGLLHSDQELFNGGLQDALVQQYGSNPSLFAANFVTAMIKMGSIGALTDGAGEIRANCRVVNS